MKRFKINNAAAGLLALLSAVSLAPADELSEYEVKAAVETWVRYETADARPDAEIEKMEPYSVDGQVVAYIAHLMDGGFCLCGADDLTLPVYLYVPDGDFDSANPAYQATLAEIQERLAALRSEVAGNVLASDYAAQLGDRAAHWQGLIAGTPSGGGIAGITEEIRLPVTCKWNQGTPYNMELSVLTPPNEYPFTGCVATATAQTMHYWKWPLSGTGANSMSYPIRIAPAGGAGTWLFTDPGIPANWAGGRLRWVGNRLEMTGYWDGSLYSAAAQLSTNATYRTALDDCWSRMLQSQRSNSVNFATHTYDWGAMPDSLPETVPGYNFPIAQLMHDVGVAVHMNWGVLISSTGTTEPIRAMRDHFRYDSDLTWNMLSDINLDVLREEIRWHRPFMFSGVDTHGTIREPLTGGNGIANTRAMGDDVQSIAVDHEAAPGATIVSPGPNGVLDSTRGGDDEVNAPAHTWLVYGFRVDGATQFLMNFGWGGASDNWYTVDAINLPGPYTLNQHIVYRIAPQNVVRFVGNGANGDGSPDNPHRTLSDALPVTPDQGRIVLRAYSAHNVGSGIINRRVTLNGASVTIRR